MPEFAANGIKMDWFDAAPASPGAGRRAVVNAFPADPGNAMRIVYAINDGPERMLRGWAKPSQTGAQGQQFFADLPATTPNERLTWRPVLSHGAETLDPGPVPVDPSEPKTETNQAQAQKFPFDLTFLARLTIPLGHNPYAIGMAPDGLRIVFPLGDGGTVRGPRFNGTIDHVGGDWMRIRDDGIGVPGARAIIKTHDGATIISEYSGLVDFGPDGQKRMADGDPPEQVNVNLTPSYLTSHPDWLWLNRLQCVGFGRVTMATLVVEYDLYAMGSHAATAPNRSSVHA